MFLRNSTRDRNRPPEEGSPPDTPTPIPSTSADAVSLVSLSTAPPSYHTRHSSLNIHFPIIQPVSPGSSQEPPTPPPALIPERRPRQSRVRGPRSRGTSWTLLRYMEQSNPPPLPGSRDPFADAGSVMTPPGTEGQSIIDVDQRHQRRQAVDGGVRLAGGPLGNEGPTGEQWDYLMSP